MRFNAKISAIEEMANLKDLKRDQLHGTLVVYEMRVGREKYKPKEETFKVSKKAKEHKDHQVYSNSKSDQEFSQLARKLKHGSRKYKGNFPFKCLYFGRVGNLSSTFPYKENSKREEDLKFGNKSQTHLKKNPYKKKGLYSKEDSSPPESNCEASLENELDKYLLMAFETDSKNHGIMDCIEE